MECATTPFEILEQNLNRRPGPPQHPRPTHLAGDAFQDRTCDQSRVATREYFRTAGLLPNTKNAKQQADRVQHRTQAT